LVAALPRGCSLGTRAPAGALALAHGGDEGKGFGAVTVCAAIAGAREPESGAQTFAWNIAAPRSTRVGAVARNCSHGRIAAPRCGARAGRHGAALTVSS
jgi:hypothetical protein